MVIHIDIDSFFVSAERSVNPSLKEKFSIDEFFGDLSGWIKDENAVAFARQLQAVSL